jgi:hypothetical protein
LKWTKQPGAGLVMICETFLESVQEIGNAGCVDVTESVKDRLIEGMKVLGTEPEEVFDWTDHLGEIYWHVIP